MTPLLWLILGASVLIYAAIGIAIGKLAEIVRLLGQLNEHSRIIRQHDLPEIARHLTAILEAIHDPFWKKYGD